MKELIKQVPMIEIVETNYALASETFNQSFDKFHTQACAYFYNRILDGDGEIIKENYEYCESVTKLDVNDEERNVLGIQWQECYLFKSSQGFISTQAFYD
ncbi:MAG: hypothetical protein GY941_21775 [Planctomycetes bacterium]|nr:hypothetical protein [Planctomycetota bacterium]